MAPFAGEGQAGAMTNTSQTHTAAGAPSVPPSSPTIYDRLRSLDISRDPNGKWVGGVCTGVARRFGLDPAIVRAAFVVLSVAFGLGITLYLLAWLLLPASDGSLMLERAVRYGEGAAITLLVVTGIAFFSDLVPDNNDGRAGSGIGLVMVAVAGWWFFTRTDQGRQMWARRGSAADLGSFPPPTPTTAGSAPTAASGGATFVGTRPQVSTGNAAAAAGARYGASPSQPSMPPSMPSTPVTRTVTRGVGFFHSLLIGGAALLVGAGLVGAGVGTVLALAVSVGIVGVAVVVAGLSGRRGGWLTLGALVGLLTLVAASPAGGIATRYGASVGDESIVVQDQAEAPRLVAGTLSVDYTKVSTAAPGVERFTARVGAGDLTVIVPKDKKVVVNSVVRLGELADTTRSDSTTVDDGANLVRSTPVSGTPDFTIDAEVGLGKLTVIAR